MWYLYFRRFALTVFAALTGFMICSFLFIWNTIPVEAGAERVELKFPFLIEGTELIAEYFVCYEGDFFEDRSGEFIMDGAALCVYNRGDTDIEFASIHIETLDGVYCFEGTCIPAHGKVVILEKYKSSYPENPVYFAAGRTMATDKSSVLDELQIEAVDLGRIKVANNSDRVLEDILLYYKRYDRQWDIYIGGVTYAISVGSLQMGESIIICPSNYADGYSKILYATAK